MCVYMLQCAREGRVGSFLPCMSWGLNSGQQAWQQAPLPGAVSRAPGMFTITILILLVKSRSLFFGGGGGGVCALL